MHTYGNTFQIFIMHQLCGTLRKYSVSQTEQLFVREDISNQKAGAFSISLMD